MLRVELGYSRAPGRPASAALACQPLGRLLWIESGLVNTDAWRVIGLDQTPGSDTAWVNCVTRTIVWSCDHRSVCHSHPADIEKNS